MKRSLLSAALAATSLLLSGCGDPVKTDTEYKAEITTGMHDSLAAQMTTWRAAAVELQAAAPTPSGRGWDATQDAAAIASMKAAWKKSRVAYEHIEGALAPIFPDLDAATDARYDDFLVADNGVKDADPFDGTGVTGMHAIERILFSTQIPSRVTDFESKLDGYDQARFPATEAEAAQFKNGICQKLIDDITLMQSQWTPSKIDLGGAFQGLISLMNEQKEKVNLAATGEEESRYAQLTLFDLRNNLDGTKTIYALFQPWLQSKKDGKTLDTAIEADFGKLGKTYAGYSGDEIPAPPAGWSADAPTEADLQTDFGRLYTAVHDSVDPSLKGSAVEEMNQAAKLLGFPEFVE